MPDPVRLEGIRIVTEPAAARLTDRQLIDYHEHRRRFLQWALNIGKTPEKGVGYATTTVKGHTYRLSQFYRFVWDEEGSYTTNLTHDHADAYIREVAYGNTTTEDKSQRVKALKILFRWHRQQNTSDVDTSHLLAKYLCNIRTPSSARPQQTISC
ncbi:hypothetical protein [Haloferax sp. YSSS75]|uniref:hypothetical protein n=1 Tax=Haloferax sp. YSSS75 TaxID=3388564 RepID=UPI00398C9701